ncbi:hypothetical protein ACJX0J_008551, partial [Zea mays]
MQRQTKIENPIIFETQQEHENEEEVTALVIQEQITRVANSTSSFTSKNDGPCIRLPRFGIDIMYIHLQISMDDNAEFWNMQTRFSEMVKDFIVSKGANFRTTHKRIRDNKRMYTSLKVALNSKEQVRFIYVGQHILSSSSKRMRDIICQSGIEVTFGIPIHPIWKQKMIAVAAMHN